MSPLATTSSRRWQVVITTPDPARSARFWRHALGYVAQPPPVGYQTWDDYATDQGIELAHGADIDAAIDPAGTAPRLLFVRDDPGRRGRISIEILTADSAADATPASVRAAATGLRVVGATLVGAVEDRDHHWVQLLDPDDNPFRVL